MRRSAVLGLLAVAIISSCGTPTASPEPNGTVTTPGPSAAAGGSLRYVALGDSYTIGTSVGVTERWPDQLVEAVGLQPPSLDLVANLGVNGFTSRDVLDVEIPQLDALRPEFVTLLVGVNDVVQGVPEDTYRRNLNAILDDLVGRVGADRILVVTTPDYTVTPAGGDFGDPARQAAGIRANNAILTAVAEGRGIAVVDIHDISLLAASDRSLVASDGLHPSAAQYVLWVERMVPVVEELLAL